MEKKLDSVKDVPQAGEPAKSNATEQDSWATGQADGAKKITVESPGSKGTVRK